MFLVLGRKIVATDDGTLRTQRILTLALIGVIVLCVEYFAGDSKLIKQFCFPLFAQGCWTHNKNLSFAGGPILANHKTGLDSFTKSHLVSQNHTFRQRTAKCKQSCINLVRIDIHSRAQQRLRQRAKVTIGLLLSK